MKKLPFDRVDDSVNSPQHSRRSRSPNDNPIADTHWLGHASNMGPYRFILGSLLLLTATACGGAIGSHQATIQIIERKVKLPDKAAPLASYERYYAQAPNGNVVGVYINHDAEQRRAILRECEGLHERPFPCPSGNKGIGLVNAGESSWLDSPMDLPGRSGGGCTQITVEYKPANGRFERVECNGSY